VDANRLRVQRKDRPRREKEAYLIMKVLAKIKKGKQGKAHK